MQLIHAKLIPHSMLSPHNKEPAMMEKMIHAAIITFLLQFLTLITPPTRMRLQATSSSRSMPSIASFFNQYFD
ncbi:hypothetical protein [Calothrix rhizosoleniae]|nr:hypothetical protein [Calothrix rhizosoleniae]